MDYALLRSSFLTSCECRRPHGTTIATSWGSSCTRTTSGSPVPYSRRSRPDATLAEQRSSAPNAGASAKTSCATWPGTPGASRSGPHPHTDHSPITHRRAGPSTAALSRSAAVSARPTRVRPTDAQVPGPWDMGALTPDCCSRASPLSRTLPAGGDRGRGQPNQDAQCRDGETRTGTFRSSGHRVTGAERPGRPRRTCRGLPGARPRPRALGRPGPGRHCDRRARHPGCRWPAASCVAGPTRRSSEYP